MKRLLTSIKQGVKLSFLRFLSLEEQGGGREEGRECTEDPELC